MTIERETYPPDQLGRATLVKKLAYVVAECKKLAELDPAYGTPNEAEIVWFKLGPKGLPYSDVSGACEAGATAVERYESIFDGRFEWHSKVFEGDAKPVRKPPLKGGKRRKRKAPRGWLLIRFIPSEVTR